VARNEPAPPATPLADPDVRVAVLVAGFHRAIAERLVLGARSRLAASGLSEANLDEVWVPGAYELPLAAQTMAETGRYAAILAVGAVVSSRSFTRARDSRLSPRSAPTNRATNIVAGRS